MDPASGSYRSKVRRIDADISVLTPAIATVPQVDAVPDDVSPSYAQTAGSPQDTARLCRDLLSDIHRARDAERAIAPSMRATARASRMLGAPEACRCARRAVECLGFPAGRSNR
jgi:hypothetical protein